MSGINLPHAVQKELDDRRATVAAADQAIRGIDEDIKRFLEEMALAKERWRCTRAQSQGEIDLIELVIQACAPAVVDGDVGLPGSNGGAPPKPNASDDASPTPSSVVLRALAEAGVPMRHTKITEATGLSSGTVAFTLYKLRGIGAVSHDRTAHLWSMPGE